MRLLLLSWFRENILNYKNMTIQTLQKNMRFLTDSKGRKTAVQLDLKTKQDQETFEDLMDILVSIERKDSTPIPFEEFKKNILSGLS
jgi:hypothetical protein